jgi:hypothetical protein
MCVVAGEVREVLDRSEWNWDSDRWANEWLGGMCTVGIEGLQPIRELTFLAAKTLREERSLPAGSTVEGATHAEALDAWAALLGRDLPVLLVGNVDRARRLLMTAFGVAEGELVGAPANCSRWLSESIKKTNKNFPLFLEMDRDLEFTTDTPGLEEIRLAWSQPVGGRAPQRAPEGTTLFVDYSQTLPAPAFADGQDLSGAATLWGLHLTEHERRAGFGALLAFNDHALYERVRDLIDPETDLPDPGMALAQAIRLSGPDGLAARQIDRFLAVYNGMIAAAGLPLAPLEGMCALPDGVAVRVPDEADIASFIGYARSEQVDVWWAPEMQPVNFVAFQVTRDRSLTQRTADNLARWLISPVGPDFLEETKHAVLVMVKTGDYTGTRWFTNPERARWYNDLLIEWYGPSHDAYHACFELPEPIAASVEEGVPADD